VSVQESIAEFEPDAAVARSLSPVSARRSIAYAAPGNAFLKRTLDLLIAVPALILCAPLFLILAFFISADSPGPVLFHQTRLGRHGKPFDIVKFRTMRVLENGDDVVQAVRNDPRITRIGEWLRRTSLDELPQLWNVILGDMSLVGPRPHARAHDKLYSILIENYDLRQVVKPGITGWAQVNGHRGETPTLEAMRSRVELDVWYARYATPWMDLKILLRTPLAVLYGRNAY
jgi:exopolysaccharide biosynthesis polyprenyl glycosylphosphotransferase